VPLPTRKWTGIGVAEPVIYSRSMRHENATSSRTDSLMQNIGSYSWRSLVLGCFLILYQHFTINFKDDTLSLRGFRSRSLEGSSESNAEDRLLMLSVGHLNESDNIVSCFVYKVRAYRLAVNFDALKCHPE
jgi:hypothetical protein